MSTQKPIKKPNRKSDKKTQTKSNARTGRSPRPGTAGTGDATLGGRILEAREARGLSLAQVSRLLGVLPKTVSNWETDSSEPRFNQLHRLAAVLHAPPMWLIGGTEIATDNDPSATTAETAGLASQLDQLTDMHAKMAAMLFEAQAERRRLQNRFDELRQEDD